MWKIIDSRGKNHLYETLKGYKLGEKYHDEYYQWVIKKFIHSPYPSPLKYTLECDGSLMTWKELT